jgi:hypothetical protein
MTKGRKDMVKSKKTKMKNKQRSHSWIVDTSKKYNPITQGPFICINCGAASDCFPSWGKGGCKNYIQELLNQIVSSSPSYTYDSHSHTQGQHKDVCEGIYPWDIMWG